MGFPDPVLQPWELRALHFLSWDGVPTGMEDYEWSERRNGDSALVTRHASLSYWRNRAICTYGSVLVVEMGIEEMEGGEG